MQHDPLVDKIIRHLNGLNEIERKSGAAHLVDVLAARYDLPREMVEKTIAEWEAGKLP